MQRTIPRSIDGAGHGTPYSNDPAVVVARRPPIRWWQTVQFAKRLRPLVQSGAVTCSVRIWHQPRVKVGGRYALPPGQIEVLAITGLTRDELSPELARRSGFDSLEDLLATAQHGSGECIFLVEFRYHDPV